MDLPKVLARIKERADTVGMSERALSIAASGSPDLIRNWRRRIAAGETGAGVNMGSLTQVAAVLGLTLDELTGGGGAPVLPHGFSAPPVPEIERAPLDWPPESRPDQTAMIRALLAPSARNPETWTVRNTLPAFGLLAGDVAIIDLARIARDGDLAIVTVGDEATDDRKTLLRRVLSPYLLSGDPADQTHPLRIDDARVTVRHPVVASFRRGRQETA